MKRAHTAAAVVGLEQNRKALMIVRKVNYTLMKRVYGDVTKLSMVTKVHAATLLWGKYI